MTIPVIMTPEGLQPQTPQALNDQLIANAIALSPGLTANLPGSLIEDMSSTGTGGLIVCDQAAVESVNNVTPRGANEFVLGNLGSIYGVQPGISTNTAVYVVFTGTVGFIIPVGFTVSDGSHTYVVQDGGIVESGGSSVPLYCVATTTGAWAVPPGTVTNLITSIPGTITLTATNPGAGTPSPGAESVDVYRARVLTAGEATSVGMVPFLKTQLYNVSGVQQRLVRVRSANGGYQVIVGGGDPYSVAYAIWKSLFDVNSLRGSILTATAITQNNPGEVTTDLNHGYITGQSVTISNSNPNDYDGTYTITVTGNKTFTLGVDTTGFAAYVGDAILTPNLRNQVITVNNYPDSYDVPFVVPPAQVVLVDLDWNTSSTNVISNTSIANLAAPAIAAYINTLYAGTPINLFGLQNAFTTAVAGVIPPEQITVMDFTVTIDGVVTAPDVGTGIINGDPESYFTSDVTGITITRV